ncbi:hypothetical protein Esi_0361_0018 [Ectocarpus siliculosus]|uniref:Uncharacterized protein n=1 Tax=Ectocarpus siliculosus TaxID=2880 RepID=D8LLH3_ECTSI|nr:hypothetical protein Esi_0361_0018 [Ectocarpus siliculosus]|eukprot:CBN76153.1 hypothetical protein Esi_0361_0018 [Ectocarpus siliculosus]
MECYQEAMRAIERERINVLNKIDLVQPSFEEQHQLEWGRRYQEEELLALRLEVGEVSREVEAETKQLRDREEIIRAIRDEQRQDRIKIQTLLALSQPITPDITVVFQALAPDACPPPLPPPSRGSRPLDRSSVPQNNRRAVTSNSPSRRSVAAAATAGTSAGRGRHLRELERLEGSFHETLTRDKQEREMHARVQKDNAARVMEALGRRTAEVEKRLSGATDDYLRLRHKAKEAHAVSAEGQRQCGEAREKSQAEVRSLVAAAEAEVEAIKAEGGRRLEDCTAGLREKLGEAEEALQGERSHHAAIKQRFEERVGRARDGVLATRRRHHKLVRRRAQEVVHLSDEMSALRRGVTELERRMFQAW